MCAFFIQLCLTVLPFLHRQAANTPHSETIHNPLPARNAYVLPDTSPAVPAVSQLQCRRPADSDSSGKRWDESTNDGGAS